jgi:hypothetical protein
MEQRYNDAMRIWVDAGISASKFNRMRAIDLMLDLGVPASVIRRVLP